MHVNNPNPAKRRPWREAYRKMPYLSISEAGWKPRFSSVTPAAANDPVVEAFAKASVQIEVYTPTGPQLDIATLIPILNPRLMSDHGPLAIEETSLTLGASAPCLVPHDRLSWRHRDEYPYDDFAMNPGHEPSEATWRQSDKSRAMPPVHSEII